MILDLNMPRMDGFEVLKALKENAKYGKISVIILKTTMNLRSNEIMGGLIWERWIISKTVKYGFHKKKSRVHLNLRRAQMQDRDQNRMLELTVYKRTKNDRQPGTHNTGACRTAGSPEYRIEQSRQKTQK
jgi:DNA-binding response OmpR family regulator